MLVKKMAKTHFLKWFHLYKENLTNDFKITRGLAAGSNIKISNKVKMENTNQHEPSNISYKIEWSHIRQQYVSRPLF